MKQAQSAPRPHLGLSRYKTLVFDCDGVVLDSNQLKIDAYYDVAMQYGADEKEAQALVDHHIKLGGISRYPKFEYFLREIMEQPVTDAATKQLLDGFAEEIHLGLLNCEVAAGLEQLREATSNANWMLISGGDELELRTLFSERNIASMFDRGIFGSPDNKEQILARELANGNIMHPALFLGDSKYDHVASTKAGLDFIFFSGWTDFEGWQDYCSSHKISVLQSLGDLIPK